MSSRPPDKGEVVWLNLSPQAGREQMGRRPALVLSPALYNARSGLAVVCPVTSQLKGYPFEVRLPEGLPVRGAVLADHIKSLDWRERQAEFVCDVPAEVVRQVPDLLDVLFQRES